MISYEGIDEAELIHGLYHGTGQLAVDTPAGLIDILHGGSKVTLRAVQEDLAEGVVHAFDDAMMHIDYYRGRPLKVRLDLRLQNFDERLYDRDAGEGAAARVIAALRARAGK